MGVKVAGDKDIEQNGYFFPFDNQVALHNGRIVLIKDIFPKAGWQTAISWQGFHEPFFAGCEPESVIALSEV